MAALLLITTDYYAVLGSSFWLSVVATAVLLSVAALRAGPLSPINSNWLPKGTTIIAVAPDDLNLFGLVNSLWLPLSPTL